MPRACLFTDLEDQFQYNSHQLNSNYKYQLSVCHTRK